MRCGGGIPNVTGSSSAMPAAGPIPGSTPMNWPDQHADEDREQPARRQHVREAHRE